MRVCRMKFEAGAFGLGSGERGIRLEKARFLGFSVRVSVFGFVSGFRRERSAVSSDWNSFSGFNL